jgi:NADH-quinone oxidoreductase subunit M
MILAWLLIITFAAGVISWLVAPLGRRLPRLICFAGLAIDAGLVIYLSAAHAGLLPSTGAPGWIAEVRTEWIKPLGISFYLAVDGLSLLLIVLTVVLGAASVAASAKEIDRRVGTFHLALMSALSGVLGVFMAMDLFLFYFFWELMLVPVFFLIISWGGRRPAAAVKFFIYTQAGGLFMFLGIIALYWIHGNATGEYTFDYTQMLEHGTPAAFAIALAFFVAFAVKLPMVPLHLWLPDAYTAAPTAGSIILAGLLSKTAGYGMLRFLFPLFSPSAEEMGFVVSILAVVSIVYGAMTAFSQANIKRLIAYSSVSHLGFVLLGIFAHNRMAMQGAVIVMLAHGLSAGSLFAIAGAIQQRLGTADMRKMGGLWTALPRMGAMTLFFALASLGLPGLANFIGEVLVLAGTFRVHPWLAGIATSVLIASTIYAVWLLYRVFLGRPRKQWDAPDLRFAEMLNLSVMAAGLLWIGVFPQTVLNTAAASLEKSLKPDTKALAGDPVRSNHALRITDTAAAQTPLSER